ncbi:MAG: alanine dehydrogenase [Rickettsiales bacterium]|nr:alanine dehydrogenase [Rickettsiales bacterium]
MKVGIPKEIKNNEFRVGLTPDKVNIIVSNGHEVFVQKDAGSAIGYSDTQYLNAGAKVVDTLADVYKNADLILKVKEPQPEELAMIKEGQVIFSYLHLAAEKELTEELIRRKAIAIAFETLTDDFGKLPLLKPMSAVAGRVAIQAACFALQKNNAGNGLLIGGVENIKPCNVLILGGGVVGENAAFVASGMGANVEVLEKFDNRIAELSKLYPNRFKVKPFSDELLRTLLVDADVVVGAILLPGKSAPKILSREHIRLMPKNSVFVDVAIDQGGCSDTSRPTTHSEPTYIEEDVIHYCVTNMPAVAAKTATLALEEATFPYLLQLVNSDIEELCKTNVNFRNGLNVYYDKLVNKSVADSLGLEYSDI